jgi:hypothetical protein
MFSLIKYNFVILFIFSLLAFIHCISDNENLKFMMEMKNQNKIYDHNDNLIVNNILPEDFFNARCYWINGWNVYDISNLEVTTSNR